MKPLPEFPTVRRLEITDRPVIERMTGRWEPFSDFGFTSLWCWDTDATCTVATARGNLVVRFRDYGSDGHFYSFLGQHDVVETAELLLAHSSREGLEVRLRLIPAAVIAADPRLAERFTVAEDPGNHDYVYAVNDWARFAGSRFGEHRRAADRCEAAFSLAGRTLDLADPGCQRELLALFAHWSHRHPVHDTSNQQPEQIALQRLFHLGADDRIAARGFFAGGRLVAFTVWEHLPGTEYALFHFQKADRDYPGLSSWQEREMARLLQEMGQALINFEQDLGIAGLRAHKRSLRPCRFLRKYTIAERAS